MILYAQAGGGHKKAAEAIAASAVYDDETTVQLVDALAEINQLIDRVICDGYRLMAKHIPQAFGFLYQKANQDSLLADLMPYLNNKFCHLLLPAIEDFKPDVIISTYHFATEMVSSLKAQGQYHGALINVITDYGLHKAWLAEHIDAYITACEEMTAPLVAAGVPTERIYPFGLPIRSSFGEIVDPKQARTILGLLPQQPLILLMAGSFGVNKVLAIYRQLTALNGDFQLAVITGRNQKLYEKFQTEIKRTSKPTKLVLFTERVPLYMQAANLLVTKPGGMTITEALASDLPMVVFDAIPGQEEDNAQFLVKRGAAIACNKELSVSDAVAMILAAPQRLNEMQQAAQSFDKKHSAANIIALAKTISTK